MITNWQTSLCGLVVAIAEIVPKYFPSLAPYAEIVAPLATIMLGLAAKDKNVTGGTIPATPEATVRVESPEVLTKAPINPMPSRRA